MTTLNALPPASLPGSVPGALQMASPVTASWSGERRASRAHRRATVRIAKYVLPLFALALLSSIALWPELSRTVAQGRVTWRRLTALNATAGQMLRPRYHGLDEHGHPYTVSSDTADRVGPLRVNLAKPVGDITMENGTWLLLKSKAGVFIEHANELDLEHAVVLYRQDGTTMTSETATMNLKQGAATSNDYTHAEGPFGVLDAQGFTIVDRGGVVQFHGPAHLVMNAAH